MSRQSRDQKKLSKEVFVLFSHLLRNQYDERSGSDVFDQLFLMKTLLLLKLFVAPKKGTILN
jgi:hypothetical protein